MPTARRGPDPARGSARERCWLGLVRPLRGTALSPNGIQASTGFVGAPSAERRSAKRRFESETVRNAPNPAEDSVDRGARVGRAPPNSLKFTSAEEGRRESPL